MRKLVELSTLIVNIAILSLLVVLYLEFKPEPPPEPEIVEETSIEEVASSEDASSKDEMDIAREELVNKWSITGLTDVTQVIDEGNSILSDDSSSMQQLNDIAKKANASNNLVNYIVEEYESYRRENYQFDFVTKKVDVPIKEFNVIRNKLMNIRNRAYLKIADILHSEGRVGEAFFYYRDAFRLSYFGGFSDNDPGVRYLAEQKMKSMLGLDSIESYKTWTKD